MSVFLEGLKRSFRGGVSNGRVAIRNEFGTELTYQRLWKLATEMAELKLSPQLQRIAINCRDPVQFSIALLATWINNSIAVPLHYSYPQSEINHRLKVARVQAIIEEDGKITKLPSSNDTLSLPTDSRLILFTSGSTGPPKGVVHSDEGLAVQMGDLKITWNMSGDDHVFYCLPLNHIHGLCTGLLNAWWNGSQATVHSQFDLRAVKERLTAQDTTFFTAVPTIYQKLLRQPGRLDHLRAMISGSSALPLTLAETFKREIFTPGITERYGMTETGMICSNVIGAGKIGSVGTAFPSIKLTIDPETDEIFVDGKGLFSGYLKGDGFHRREALFRTGDQGVFENDSLRLLGRDRDIFKVAGYKVAAGEIESVLLQVHSIEECSVCAIPEPRDESSQIICAFVVSKSAKVDELKRFLSNQLAYYKIPRKWHVQSEALPRNIIGKPDYVQIRNKFMPSP